MFTTTNVTPIKSGKAEEVVPVACAFIIAMGATIFIPSEPANGTDASSVAGSVNTETNTQINRPKDVTEWKDNMDRFRQNISTPQHRAGDIDDVSSNNRYLGLRQHYCKESLAGAYNNNHSPLGTQIVSVMLERNSSSISCFV